MTSTSIITADLTFLYETNNFEKRIFITFKIWTIIETDISFIKLKPAAMEHPILRCVSFLALYQFSSRMLIAWNLFKHWNDVYLHEVVKLSKLCFMLNGNGLKPL